jgi:hypothetical protein
MPHINCTPLFFPHPALTSTVLGLFAQMPPSSLALPQVSSTHSALSFSKILDICLYKVFLLPWNITSMRTEITVSFLHCYIKSSKVFGIQQRLNKSLMSELNKCIYKCLKAGGALPGADGSHL